jgi:drug/metabolite transporter (DMT)-like permease
MSTPSRQGPPATDPQATAGCEAVGATTARRAAHWPRIVLALAAVYIFWGSSYIAIKTAGEDFPPLLLMGLRNVLAGALFLTLAFAQRRPLGRLREWGHACVVGVLMISVGATLLAMGMRYESPGMAAVTFACVPVVVCLMLALKGSPITLAQWLGTLVGSRACG